MSVNTMTKVRLILTYDYVRTTGPAASSASLLDLINT